MANKTSDKAFYSIDLLPSLCELTGVPLPESEIDGKNVWPLIAGEEGAVNPQDYYAISTGNTLESIMSGDGKWKLHIPHSYRTLLTPGVDGTAGKYETKNIELSLFDMVNDPYESVNVSEKFPEVTEKLMGYAISHKNNFYKDD